MVRNNLKDVRAGWQSPYLVMSCCDTMNLLQKKEEEASIKAIKIELTYCKFTCAYP